MAKPNSKPSQSNHHVKPLVSLRAGGGKPVSLPEAPVGSHWSRNTRETIESIAIAFALAFLFKAFEAEAFVIPTGSMAPTLMGRHKDVVCPECGYRYSASASEETDREGYLRPGDQHQIIGCTCPICRLPISVDPQDPQSSGRDASPSYSGDRIWVSKVPYEMADPARWDVAVFRFPEEAETYYIKRLVGLPNETVRLYHGDLYTKGHDEAEFSIQRKPPDKVRAMAQVVHDNDYVSKTLQAHHWPARWQPAQQGAAAWQASDDARSYRVDGSSDSEAWIRYHHTVPTEDDWYAIEHDRWSAGQVPRAQLITDFYAFDTRVTREEQRSLPAAMGLHWVGDLILDCRVDVQSPQGTVLLDLVKAGQHFRCEIDVATGAALLKIVGLDGWERKAPTSIHGTGMHDLAFANVDRQLVLWVDGSVVAFDQPTTYDQLNDDHPHSTADDPGDLAPLGIGSRGAKLAVDRLRVSRDIYYIADRYPDARQGHAISDYDPGVYSPAEMSAEQLVQFYSSPEMWENSQRGNVFDARQAVEYPLDDGQFFMLGDNSPASYDARLWRRQNYVERELLVGKALFVYWPHPWGVFVPFTNVSLPLIPNVRKMGLIR